MDEARLSRSHSKSRRGQDPESKAAPPDDEVGHRFPRRKCTRPRCSNSGSEGTGATGNRWPRARQGSARGPVADRIRLSDPPPLAIESDLHLRSSHGDRGLEVEPDPAASRGRRCPRVDPRRPIRRPTIPREVRPAGVPPAPARSPGCSESRDPPDRARSPVRPGRRKRGAPRRDRGPGGRGSRYCASGGKPGKRCAASPEDRWSHSKHFF